MIDPLLTADNMIYYYPYGLDLFYKLSSACLTTPEIGGCFFTKPIIILNPTYSIITGRKV
jgi:hypothetical protein